MAKFSQPCFNVMALKIEVNMFRTRCLLIGFMLLLSWPLWLEASVPVEKEIRSGETIFRIHNGSCDIQWIVTVSHGNGRLRSRVKCKQPLDVIDKYFHSMFSQIVRDYPDVHWRSMLVGRLVPVPEWSRRLAEAAAANKSWQGNRRDYHFYAYVKNQMNNHGVLKELVDLFKQYGIDAKVSGVEKVLVAKVSYTLLAESMLKAGIDPDTKVYYDAIVDMALTPIKK